MISPAPRTKGQRSHSLLARLPELLHLGHLTLASGFLELLEGLRGRAEMGRYLKRCHPSAPPGVLTSCWWRCCTSCSRACSCCRSVSSSCICHSCSWTVCFSISRSSAVSWCCAGSWGSLRGGRESWERSSPGQPPFIPPSRPLSSLTFS